MKDSSKGLAALAVIETLHLVGNIVIRLNTMRKEELDVEKAEIDVELFGAIRKLLVSHSGCLIELKHDYESIHELLHSAGLEPVEDDDEDADEETDAPDEGETAYWKAGVELSPFFGYTFQCSDCEWGANQATRYCPHCGKQMRRRKYK